MLGPRHLAFLVLREWESRPPARREGLNQLAGRFVAKAGKGDRRDPSLFWELVMGVVRWRSLLDFHLDSRLKEPSRVPLPVRILLRLGAYQLFFLQRIPSRAAVNETVALARKVGAAWAAGLVNAVLRRIAAKVEEVGRERAREVARGELGWRRWAAISTSHPEWMVQLLEDELGRDSAEEILAFNNLKAPCTLRVNSSVTDRGEFMALLRRSGVVVRPGLYASDAVILEGPCRPASLPGYRDGAFYVQDEAAQLASIILNPMDGERILDLCAGVGGKTTHLAQLFHGEVWATDVDESRLSVLEENASRLGLKGIKVVEMERVAAGKVPRFDGVMVDAPCSGLGVIRRHPDIKWNRNMSALDTLARKQRELLERAAQVLSPNGRIVYATCTFTGVETRGVVERFLEDRSGFAKGDLVAVVPPPAREFISSDGFFRTGPQPGGPDLFFVALLENRG